MGCVAVNGAVSCCRLVSGGFPVNLACSWQDSIADEKRTVSIRYGILERIGCEKRSKIRHVRKRAEFAFPEGNFSTSLLTNQKDSQRDQGPSTEVRVAYREEI